MNLRRRWLMSMVCGLLMTGVTVLPARAQAPFDHQDWTRLLQRHVVVLHGGQASQVDYDGLRRDRVALNAYLARLSAVPSARFDQMPGAHQLAFLINAYNAWTVELVLRGKPDLASIRELGGLLSSPWEKSFIPLLGATRSLDDIEHHLIRGSGRYQEPRIHFAVNCASIGCPPLREEAYDGARLEAQLADATRRFLADRTRNRLGAKGLEISSIFRWYREDFDTDWPRGRGLGGFLASHGDALGLEEQQRRALVAGDLRISFLEYDWRLNRVR